MDLSGRKILVVGLARSGVAVGGLLRRHGARIIGVDDAPEAEVRRRWTEAGLAAAAEHAFDELRTGGGWGDLATEELYGVALSPGVPRRHPRLQPLPATTPVWSEVEWAARAFGGTVVAVTGTNGKSTTTELAAHLLRAAGREAEALGNVGRPFAERADRLPATAVVVLELSSYQLEAIASLRPRVATVLNLAPDHLDRYDGVAAYYAAKRRLSELLPPDGTYVTWTGCAEARRWRPAGPRLLFGEAAAGADVALEEGELRLRQAGRWRTVVELAELPLPAPVHHLNAAAAVASVWPLESDVAALGAGLRSFRGLPHRHQVVGAIGRVRFVDDSKATNVHAVCGGLRGYPAPVVLILGGRGKGEDYVPLRDALAPVRAVVTIGEEGPAIAAALAEHVAITAAADLPAAVRLAHELAQPRGTVLLSPGCASFDMFRDYAARGEAFAAAARALGAAPVDDRDHAEPEVRS